MDTLRQAASDSDLGMMITTGAIYGIFLVFGEAWSEFLKIAVLSISPSHENEVLAGLIYALSASAISVFFLVIVVKTHKITRQVTSTNLSNQTRRIRTYFNKSRADIANGK